MKCVLPTLGKCDVVVIYARDEKRRPVHTSVEVFTKNEDGSESLLAEGKSMCHKNDVCVKLQGRAWALKHLFQDFNFSKEDKTALFALVCPTMFNKNKVNKLANRNRPGYRWLQAKLGY